MSNIGNWLSGQSLLVRFSQMATLSLLSIYFVNSSTFSRVYSAHDQFHILFSRREFKITEVEESAIAAAAIIGFSIPVIARGIAIAL